ncbi:putative G-protein coupled receptor [Echinococcus granulosus]|uniref:G-protein coupled receptor n=1 Tax=Echinococcus granulosus TaxID=6210 RepID=W6UGQ9_ECHGR|nr:putative G-protein coupled receptor [Echinococcus granulosus]EUB57302.1 putative G-protein coupled receptor [Echinococcus granulosus]
MKWHLTRTQVLVNGTSNCCMAINTTDIQCIFPSPPIDSGQYPTLAPEPVPAPTTPPLRPIHPSPKENLFNVTYLATANHYWTFSSGTKWILDQAPEENFLSKALFDRYKLKDFDGVDLEIKDDFEKTPNSLFAPMDTMDGFIGVRQLGKGLFPEDTKSVWLSRQSSTKCFKLVPKLEVERPYFKTCITDPENCEYGLSVSIWVYFQNVMVASRQTLISTSPANECGFLMSIEYGMFIARIYGSLHTWTCSASIVIEKGTWNNFAFLWKSTNGDTSIYVNKRLLASCAGIEIATLNGIARAKAESLWLGCSSDGVLPNDQTSILDAFLSHPTLWYWPLEHHVLFLGDKADRFEALPSPIPTPSPSIDYMLDYTRLVDEYQPKNWSQLPTNPYYITADGFFELNTEPRSKTGFRDIELNHGNCRGRSSYRLKSINAYYRLKGSVEKTCPSSFLMCQSGFSIGAWITVPSTLTAKEKPKSLFEIAGNIKVALFGDFLHIFVFNGKAWKITRINEAVVRDEVFNVGFSITGDANNLAAGFINGLSVQTMAFASLKPQEMETHEEIHVGDIILGSRDVSCSADGVSIGDLVYWNRLTLLHEGHRFVGYTDNYWSTDAYILHDALCRISFEKKRQQITKSDEVIPGYKLASIYKPMGVQPVRYILDQDRKGPVPILSMRKNDYFMLGRRKHKLPSQANLQWLDHCLHEPSNQSCGVQGVTLSIWFSLQSVSKSRIRHIFNSGDAGNRDISTVMDGHGWAIFTHGALLGASVSTSAGDWTLLLDSKTYNLDQWLNLGVTWSTTVGLKLFVNGIDLNMPSTKPKTRYKEYTAPPYLLVGRFDTDDLNAWLTPAEAETDSSNPSVSGIPVFWEMAHFAFSEMTHVKKYMTSQEYARNFGFLGNEMIQKNSKWLWFGPGLTDPSIPDLLLTSQLDIPRQFGPYAMHNASTFSVQYEEDRRAVILGQMTLLRLGPLDPFRCPGSMSECRDGFTIGGWYSLISDIDGMGHTNFTSPLILLTGNGGEMGIALTDGGNQITGWVNDAACSGSSEDLTITSHHNRWFHVAISWFYNEIHLFLNGNHISNCMNNSELKRMGEDIFNRTETNPAYLVVIGPSQQGFGYRLAVSIINIWDTCIDSELNIGAFMGLSRTQRNYFARATFYWPMSGLFANLAPSRIITSGVERAKDKRNVEGGAMCTGDTEGSYILLTGDYRPGGNYSNLYYSCLYNINQCHGLLLVVDFRLNGELKMENRESIILKTPTEGGAVGIEISVNPIKETLTVTHRTLELKCTLSANLSSVTNAFDGWTNLQAFVSEHDIRLRINEEIVSVQSHSLCSSEESKSPSFELGSFPKILIGPEVNLCVSDVVIIEDAVQVVPEDPDLNDACYSGSDVIFPLEGEQPDRLGRAKKATDFSSFTIRVMNKKLLNCLRKFMTLCSEFTLSFWMNIRNVYVDASSVKDYMVLSTGPNTYQGFSISVQYIPKSSVYHLLVRLVTSDSIYQVFATEFGKSDEWLNVGVVVGGAKTSAGVYVEVYKNGHALMTTSSPISRVSSKCYRINPSSGLYLGSAITTMANMSAVPIASGTISMLVFWLKRVASCGTPRSSYMTLMGDCVFNETLPETTTCQEASNCQLSQNGVCLDTSVENIYAMARGARLISSPKALYSLLKVILVLLKNDSRKYDSDYETRLLWSSVVLYDRLSVVEEATAFEIESLRSKTDEILVFLLEYLEALFSTRFAKTWLKLRESYSSKPPEIVAMLAAMLEVLLTNERPVIETSLGRNYLASFSGPTNLSHSDGEEPFKVIISSLGGQTISKPSNRTFTISILSSSIPEVIMDVLSVPKEFAWTEDVSSLKDDVNKSEVISALINSPIMTTSLISNTNDQGGSGIVFLYTLALIQPNEYSERAIARRTDALHWKARLVEKKGHGAMEYAVKCVFWDDTDVGAKGWTANHCDIAEAHLLSVVCRCNRTGSLAVAMRYTENDESFWEKAGSISLQSYQIAKLVINLAGNSLSIIALTALIVYLCRKNTLPELRDHNKIKLNLIAALVCYHICYMLFPLMEETEIACRTIGSLEHFSSSTVLAWQCCNNFYIFNALINGKLKARFKSFVFIGWIANAVILIVTVCATSASEYGMGLMCLPTGISGYIATAESTIFLFVSLVSCIILLCNIDAPAYLSPRVIEALRNDVRTATVASVYSSIIYGLALVFIYLNPLYEGFIFWALNALTGCVVATLLGPLDKSNVVKKRRSSGALDASKILGSSIRTFGNTEDHPTPFGTLDFESIESPLLSEADAYLCADMEEKEGPS